MISASTPFLKFAPLVLRSPGAFAPEVAAAAAQNRPLTGKISAKPWTDSQSRAKIPPAGPLKCYSVH